MSFINFEDTLKASHAYNLIRNDFSLGLGHAYMVVSSDDDTVADFFTLIGATVFCETKSACGECKGCNTVAHGNHPDVFRFNKGGETVKVSDVKELTASTELKSASGIKLYFVHRADLMNAAAQNKLLKTLEEPPKGVSIFLGVSNEAAILSTIKSRCRSVYLDVFDNETVRNALLDLGCDKDLAEIAAACSEGQLGRALKIARSTDYIELYHTAINVLAGLKKSTDVLRISKNDALLNRTDEIFDILSIILRDVIAVKEKSDVVSKHVGEDVAALADGFSVRAAAECITLINNERKKLALNVNKQAVIDNLLFSILEVKYKWR